ncbi:hypothetical protein BDF14DRAFT_1823006 [Spinellus fusiger]|nr:hypothetical protein BDF14DRAFT_1823006 [Spinellus fusiger]
MLSALPDRTPEQIKTHSLFQHPMVTVTINNISVDLWVGDIVYASPGKSVTLPYKLASFFMSSGRFLANTYEEASGLSSVRSIVILDITVHASKNCASELVPRLYKWQYNQKVEQV